MGEVDERVVDSEQPDLGGRHRKRQSLTPLGQALQQWRERPALQPGPDELARRPYRRNGGGLRSAEVAARAGLDPGYYAKLEQGRATSPSVQVLESLVRALELNNRQAGYLYSLAGQQRGPQPGPGPELVPPTVLALLHYLGEAPAFVQGRQWDLLAWNDALASIMGDPAEYPPKQRNVAWLMFRQRNIATIMHNWPTHARRLLSQFRLSWGRYRDDPRFVELIEELSGTSEEFREWWPEHDVEGEPEAEKTITPAGYGQAISYLQSAWAPPGNPDVIMVVYVPDGKENADRAKECLQIYLARKGVADLRCC